MDVGQHYLEDALNEFRRLKKSADKAMAQVSDAEFSASWARRRTASRSS
ncbi:MAG TPA: DUF1572 family protein [Terriglobales bacterium]|nr:DUF1572 family protein [Terriglobales bacterium]